VLGISALYNHCFYLADLSPEDPQKLWAPMAQTGVRNITEMVGDAAAAQQAHPDREFLGVATASFSKHRLRAFDSLWYGFILNGQSTWTGTQRPFADYQPAFTRAFVRHWYDLRDDASTAALAVAVERLDRAKSRLELANQTLHDVVGVYDTQEAGYQGNTLLGAWQRCRELLGPDGKPLEALTKIRDAAQQVTGEAAAVLHALAGLQSRVGRPEQLAELHLAAEQIRSHADRQLLMVAAQEVLTRAPSLPRGEAQRQASAEAERWRVHRDQGAAIGRRLAPLYSQGDPCGAHSLLRDVTVVADHLTRLATAGPRVPLTETGALLLEEPFAALDPARWTVLGQPQLAAGRMETRAPGGWGKYCGLLSQEVDALDADRPLVIEFELTPWVRGIDSQLFASASQPGDISYRFAFYGPRDRFGVHTQSSVRLGDGWIDPSPGWRLRALSPEAKPGAPYRIRAELTRRTWRVSVRRQEQGPWEIPFWDSGAVPMDELADPRLLFADVEPENSAGASRWGPIRVWRGEQPGPPQPPTPPPRLTAPTPNSGGDSGTRTT